MRTVLSQRTAPQPALASRRRQTALRRRRVSLAAAGTALALGLGALGLGAPRAALAQAWPSKPIRLVTPYAPGGTNDVSARIIAERLGERLGQRVVVENKPGANTQIATDAVVKSAPDGYTLLWTAAPHTTNPALFAKLPYDTVADLTPINRGVALPLLFSVPQASPAKSLKEYVALAKKDAAQATIASPGNGSGPHLAIELWAGVAEAPFLHIPYGGDAKAVVDMVGGAVGAGMNGFGTPLPHVKSGKLRALGVVGTARMPQLPDVPTFAEAGYPEVDAFAWFGLLGPARLPAPIVARLNDEVGQILKEPAVIEKLATIGAVPVGGTPAEFDAFIRNDIARWQRVVKSRGIKVQ
ncbi:MAG: Bug family tripartite tricarboxylate transporter substrate binding protein [Lautropia sp.]